MWEEGPTTEKKTLYQITCREDCGDILLIHYWCIVVGKCCPWGTVLHLGRWSWVLKKRIKAGWVSHGGQASKYHSSMVPSVPTSKFFSGVFILTSFHDGLCAVRGNKPFFPELLLVMIFNTEKEKQARERGMLVCLPSSPSPFPQKEKGENLHNLTNNYTALNN